MGKMKIVLTLTTIPSRLNSIHSFDIKYCLESLINQNHDDYEIHLNIPHTYKRTGETYIIPEWMNKYDTNSKLKVYRTEDYGSITKLIPTLERLNNDDIMIVVDDDVVYHPEMINEHIKNRKRWPNYVIGYDGIRSKNEDGSDSTLFGDSRDHYFTACKTNKFVDIIQHYKSVSYLRKFFDDDFLNFWNTNGVWCDDKTISAYLSYKKIARLVTYYDGDPDFDSHEKWLAGIRHTFPVDKHTSHETQEGCNLDRKDDSKEIHKKINNLYKFIDGFYIGKTWKI